MWTIQRFSVNPLQENCYVVSDESNECVFIDCGAQSDSERRAIRQYIEIHKLKPVHLLNTHLHFDHVLGNDFIFSTYGLKCEANERDCFLYNNVPGQLRLFMGEDRAEFNAPFGCCLDEGDSITFGTHTLKVIAIPGHTPGGLGFYCEEEEVLFSGDSLFRCSIGRTDLPQGNHFDLIKALKKKVLALPDSTVVYPGHGPSTTVGDERLYNPYL